MAKTPRPLSPHLQIYKPQISSVLSIAHRISGVGLFVGLLGFIAFLGSLADGPGTLNCFLSLLASWPGRIIAFGVSAAFFYHTANGVRHLAWDIGYGYDLPTMHKTGYAVIAFTLLATLLFWLNVAVRS